MSLGNAFLALNVLVWGGFGVVGFLAPESLLTGAGVVFGPGSSSVDLRATYGGIISGFAIFLLVCMGSANVRLGIASVFLITFGALCGRVYGLALEAAPAIMWQIAIIEAVWCVLAVGLWLRYPRSIQGGA